MPVPRFGSSVPQAGGGPPFTETLSPAAHASGYTFTTPVSDSSPYTVSIDTQPSNPAQICSVANGTGTVSGGNVTNVDVSCTAVTHTVTATAGANGSASPPSQSVNDGSTAIVTLAPSVGFTASASGCGGSLGGDGVTYTTAAITADCTVTATFTPIPQSPTTTALSLSPNPTLTNQPVTASVTVTSGALPTGTRVSADGSKIATAIAAATPTGAVGISGGGQSCNATLMNGSGSCTLAYAAPGTYTINATYPGDAQNQPSSATASLAVAAPTPAVPSPMLGGIALVVLGLAVLALTLQRRWADRR